MKKTLIAFCIMLVAVGFAACSEFKHRDLFKITDRLVESLYTEYESYGMFGGTPEYTPDKEYKVMPIGRLVNVRIEHVATDKEYEDLLEALKSHYKGNNHVNDVYKNNGGTLMIDCRN